MFLWGASAVFQGVYALLQRLNIPLIVQPQLFGFLCLVSWGQCQYYGTGRSRWAATAITLSVIILFGLLELFLVIFLRPPHDRGERAATTTTKALGIVGSVLISVALFPQYWQIFKHKEVIGISLLFISIDMLGGIFNDLSLAFRAEFDVIAAVTYSLVVVSPCST
ncbi:hypothetical protein M413DRAFT_442512 [Hebeloma cylindrosporum]|uniref:Uncharacterized protein n=1 Tax=Hebeloma cylindrosporum TaxID=76867 RepID=A0A0C2Y3Z6_HEBCY|nr:hypothetical protein M413DRAFT_442512 [Hebeloma cylindrosporum h7]